jgi:hypothetical protein
MARIATEANTPESNPTVTAVPNVTTGFASPKKCSNVPTNPNDIKPNVQKRSDRKMARAPTPPCWLPPC